MLIVALGRQELHQLELTYLWSLTLAKDLSILLLHHICLFLNILDIISALKSTKNLGLSIILILLMIIFSKESILKYNEYSQAEAFNNV